jgi:hypothetical protein
MYVTILLHQLPSPARPIDSTLAFNVESNAAKSDKTTKPNEDTSRKLHT